MASKKLDPQPHTLSPSTSGRRRTRTIKTDECTSSPEFEFWMVRNPSCPQPNILSADELFVDGVLLPLHLLSTQPKPNQKDITHHSDPETPTSESPPPDLDPDPEPEPSASIADSSIVATSTNTTLSASKRWKDIFRKSEKKNAENKDNTEESEKDKEKATKKKERKGGGGTAASSAAELNINIWPFSRSRSAGNAGTRPKLFPGAPVTRKSNSAPCSRSNSAGESKSRKWPNSPGRGGVHLGRSSPVWQVRRGGSKNLEPLFSNPEKWSKRESATSRRGKASSSASAVGGGKAKVLNLNVPTCIGYKTNLNCKSDVNSAAGSIHISGTNSNGNGGDGSNVGGKLFNLRCLFTKKILLTSH